MIPETDKQFASAANALATTFLDRFARMGMAPDEIANLCGAALGTVLANQLGPFGAVSRLRDMADVMEREIMGIEEQLD